MEIADRPAVRSQSRFYPDGATACRLRESSHANALPRRRPSRCGWHRCRASCPELTGEERIAIVDDVTHPRAGSGCRAIACDMLPSEKP
jgi:hypothetical protein